MIRLLISQYLNLSRHNTTAILFWWFVFQYQWLQLTLFSATWKWFFTHPVFKLNFNHAYFVFLILKDWQQQYRAFSWAVCKHWAQLPIVKELKSHCWCILYESLWKVIKQFLKSKCREIKLWTTLYTQALTCSKCVAQVGPKTQTISCNSLPISQDFTGEDVNI